MTTHEDTNLIVELVDGTTDNSDHDVRLRAAGRLNALHADKARLQSQLDAAIDALAESDAKRAMMRSELENTRLLLMSITHEAETGNRRLEQRLNETRGVMHAEDWETKR